MLQTSSSDERTIAQCCVNCGAEIKARKGFGFKNPRTETSGEATSIVKCFGCALRHGPMLKRSVIAGLVVGSILTLLNQGDTLLSGDWNNALYWKIPLTYCVPFLVASFFVFAAFLVSFSLPKKDSKYASEESIV